MSLVYQLLVLFIQFMYNVSVLKMFGKITINPRLEWETIFHIR